MDVSLQKVNSHVFLLQLIKAFDNVILNHCNMHIVIFEGECKCCISSCDLIRLIVILYAF